MSLARQTTPPGTAAGAAWLRRPGLILLLVVLSLGLAVRFRQYLAAPSYWYDEAYLLVNIFDKTCAELVGPLRCDQAAPPLFLWTLRGAFLVAGPSEWAMRLPAFVATLAALLLSIPLARRVVGGPAWVWYVGFVALSHHALTHGVEVKPYANDLLMTEVVLLAGSCVVTGHSSSPGRRWGFVGLLAAAALGPWLSYPSVFVLGGASLALLADAWARKGRSAWLAFLALNAVTLASCVAVWLVAARHQRTRALEQFWATAFVDLSSFGGAVLWVANRLVDIGNYGTTGMGIPLVLLGGLGLAILGRKSPPLFALLLGPLLVAGVANGLRRYPLEDRLLFFAAPCLWLSAAVGVGGVLHRLRGRWVGAGVVALSVLLAPGFVRFCKHLVVVSPKAEFREAFALATRQGSPTDCWWVSHPEIAEVYLGKDAPYLLRDVPPEGVAAASRGGPLWVIAAMPPKGQPVEPELVANLEAAGLRLKSRHDLPTVAVRLYAWPGGR